MTSRRQCWAFTPIHLIPPHLLPAVPTVYLYNPVCEMGQDHPTDEALRPQARTVLSLCHVKDEPQETAPFAHF